jgi:DNA polymerase bacteriophage-type
MLRPSLMAPSGKRLVVADWAAIEARVTPWASNTNSGAAKLGIFERGEDVYKHNAAATFRVHYADVDKDQRQIGKVQELACGFAGGSARLPAWAASTTSSCLRATAAAWSMAGAGRTRGRRPTGRLERAYTAAMRNPGSEFRAGRVTYFYDKQHLWYALPSGRVLCYPFARFNEEGDLTYAKARGSPPPTQRNGPAPACGAVWPARTSRRPWPTICCVTRCGLDAEGFDVVLHVHDEIVLETDAAAAEDAAAALVKIMCTPPAWAAGLPLNAEVAVMQRYGK